MLPIRGIFSCIDSVSILYHFSISIGIGRRHRVQRMLIGWFCGSLDGQKSLHLQNRLTRFVLDAEKVCNNHNGSA